jgi:integrase
VCALDLDDIATDNGGRWQLTCRRRKNDQEGAGLVCAIDEAQAEHTIALLRTWLFIRGNTDGPLFPGRRGTARRHTDAVRAGLRETAEQAGIRTERIGPHSFRRTAISDLLDRGVNLFRVAKRTGITAQTTLNYFEQLPFATSVGRDLGLEEEAA